jgi:hypothetical protein
MCGLTARIALQINYEGTAQMTDGQETSASETKIKGRAQAAKSGHDSGASLAEKRKENKRKKKMAHRRTLRRSHTTG